MNATGRRRHERHARCCQQTKSRPGRLSASGPMPQCRFRPGRARSEKNTRPKLGQTVQRESPPVLAGLDRFDRQDADPHPSGTPSNRRAIVPNDARPTGLLTDTRSCRRRRAQKWRGIVVLVHANCAGFSPILQTVSRWRKLEIPTINLRLWRWGWDSNPRYACAYNGFRDRPVQPLRHPTADRLSRGFLQAGPVSANLFLNRRAAEPRLSTAPRRC